MRTTLCLVIIALTGAGCTETSTSDAGADAGPRSDGGPDDGDAGPSAGADAGSACVGPPGLYEDGACGVISADLRAYTPRFELWTDGATKERYIFLPEGTQIDTSDPDQWEFPIGTRVYKTFTLAGLRLETRVLEKVRLGVGVGSWAPTVYAWNLAQDRVTDVTNAAPAELENVLGTDHDIPDGRTCLRCHIGRDTHDMVNGFSAFQLNHDGGGLTYQTLLDEGRVTDPFARADAEAPGDATAVAALGYLHANCGYCHRPGGDPAAEARGFFMRLEVGASATVEATTTFRTGVNVLGIATFGDALCRFMPGDPTNSVAVHRLSSRVPGVAMPPLQTEIVNPEGTASVTAWVDGLTIPPAAECAR